jgi:hypothetical protein
MGHLASATLEFKRTRKALHRASSVIERRWLEMEPEGEASERGQKPAKNIITYRVVIQRP